MASTLFGFERQGQWYDELISLVKTQMHRAFEGHRSNQQKQKGRCDLHKFAIYDAWD
jgi:hypothetical protein